jgi:hypothetical protein
MRSTVAIVIDGVLRHEVGHRPIAEGLMLYRVLAPVYNVVLLGDQDDPPYVGEVMHFYSVENLTQHSRTLYGDTSSIDLGPRRLRSLLRLRNSGMAVDFVVEPDPSISARLFEYGFNVMHFMHSQYARPQWRPDHKHEVVPWDELVMRETAAKRLKAEDMRTDR